MNKSPSIANLAQALMQFQAEVSTVQFDSKNPFLKNNYASLGAAIQTSKPFLSKFGLSISQFPVSSQTQVGVTTILMHVSGEFLEETCLMTPEKAKGVNDGQSAGIVITYCRRYAWLAVLGLVGDADTDAHVEEKEIKRVFSIEALEEVIKAGVADNHGDAMEILEYSVLPETTPIKTVAIWTKKYAESEGTTPIACADAANAAYLKAKSTKKETKQ